MLQLFIGNKNYSSWSMRPWVLLKQAQIPFEEVMLRFDAFEPGSAFKTAALALHPSGKVPLLRDGDLLVWDSLAIAEYLAEKFPEKQLWPQSPPARAQARSACAEMHSGFQALRRHCPMNIEAPLGAQGKLIWRDQPSVRADVARIVQLWEGMLAQYGGAFLAGDFGTIDAFFAPVCMRIARYALPVSSAAAAYIDRVSAAPGVAAWIAEALAEADFRPFEEPYRLGR